MTLTYILLDGAGGGEPGKIAARTRRALTSDERFTFSEALEDARLASAHQSDGPAMVVDEDGNEFMTVCADGTQIVVERLSRNKRTFITRHECELGQYPELGNLYATVSKLGSPD